MKKVCRHLDADRVKPGSKTIKAMSCPKCKKIIVKGKPSGGGWGVSSVLRNIVKGKDFVVRKVDNEV